MVGAKESIKNLQSQLTSLQRDKQEMQLQMASQQKLTDGELNELKRGLYPLLQAEPSQAESSDQLTREIRMLQEQVRRLEDQLQRSSESAESEASTIRSLQNQLTSLHKGGEEMQVQMAAQKKLTDGELNELKRSLYPLIQAKPSQAESRDEVAREMRMLRERLQRLEGQLQDLWDCLVKAKLPLTRATAVGNYSLSAGRAGGYPRTMHLQEHKLAIVSWSGAKHLLVFTDRYRKQRPYLNLLLGWEF